MKRRGRIFFTFDFMERMEGDEQLVTAVFDGILVTGVFVDWGRRVAEYTVSGRAFDPVHEGSLAPKYSIAVLDEDPYKVEFKKIE